MLNLVLQVRFFCFIVKGVGLELRYACSSQRECVLAVANEVRLSTRRGKAETKELFFVSTFLFFLGGGRGFYFACGSQLRADLLTVCFQLRAKRSRASPSFASCYALATAKGRPSPKPSLTPLHVRSCCTACRFIWRCHAANFKFSIFKVRVSATQNLQI